VDNVELVKRAFETLAREGLEGILDFIHPEFETEIPPELSAEPDTYRGHEGVRRWFGGFEGYMEDVRLELVDDPIGAGDKVVVPARLVARGSDSGIEVEQRVFQVWTIRDGRAIRVVPFPDLARARAAAGLPADI
jgi:ketosteroid isomerase-like protein